MTTPYDDKTIEGFSVVTSVLANPKQFKKKLGIGDEAYASLRTEKAVSQLWEIAGAAGSGASLVGAPLIAIKFFQTFWSHHGQTTAVTPVSWIASAAVVAGEAWYGVIRLFKSYAGSRAKEKPKFLNCEFDVLAIALFDLIGNLAVKVAVIDRPVDESEVAAVNRYFTEEWGFDSLYLDHALAVVLENIEETRVSEMSTSLANFVFSHRECDFDAIRCEIRRILIEVANADGKFGERQVMIIDFINRTLQGQASIARAANRASSINVRAARVLLKKAARKLFGRKIGRKK